MAHIFGDETAIGVAELISLCGTPMAGNASEPDGRKVADC
jgi:hypothetical protein